MSSIYDRQKELKLNTDHVVAVVGCGGIGFHVAKMLCMSGVKTFYLYDPDIWEDHNLNRIDIPQRFVGQNKAEVTKGVMTLLRDDITVYSFPFPFDTGLLDPSVTWIVDCTDKDDVQLKNQEIADSAGVKYFKAGYDGESFGIHNRVAEWGESTDGYTIVPSWIVPAVLIASLAVAKICKYPDKECSSSVDRLFRIDR